MCSLKRGRAGVEGRPQMVRSPEPPGLLAGLRLSKPRRSSPAPRGCYHLAVPAPGPDHLPRSTTVGRKMPFIRHHATQGVNHEQRAVPVPEHRTRRIPAAAFHVRSAVSPGRSGVRPSRLTVARGRRWRLPRNCRGPVQRWKSARLAGQVLQRLCGPAARVSSLGSVGWRFSHRADVVGLLLALLADGDAGICARRTRAGGGGPLP